VNAIRTQQLTRHRANTSTCWHVVIAIKLVHRLQICPILHN